MAAAGTAEKLVGISTYCFRVDVCADTGNRAAVVTGDVNVVAASGAQQGTILLPGVTVPIYIDDVSKIYVDAIQNGDAVSFTYYIP